MTKATKLLDALGNGTETIEWGYYLSTKALLAVLEEAGDALQDCVDDMEPVIHPTTGKLVKMLLQANTEQALATIKRAKEVCGEGV